MILTLKQDVMKITAELFYKMNQKKIKKIMSLYNLEYLIKKNQKLKIKIWGININILI